MNAIKHLLGNKKISRPARAQYNLFWMSVVATLPAPAPAAAAAAAVAAALAVATIAAVVATVVPEGAEAPSMSDTEASPLAILEPRKPAISLA